MRTQTEVDDWMIHDFVSFTDVLVRIFWKGKKAGGILRRKTIRNLIFWIKRRLYPQKIEYIQRVLENSCPLLLTVVSW